MRRTDISQDELRICIRWVPTDNLRKDTSEPSTRTGNEDDLSSMSTVSVGCDRHCGRFRLKIVKG